MTTKTTKRLAPNHQLVLEVLLAAARPVTAYELLDALRPRGITAPPTVYRALRRLVDEGRVHRVESLNAFIACGHTHHDDTSVMFMICDKCGETREVTDSKMAARLSQYEVGSNFQVQRAMLELHGNCGNCTDDSAGAS